MDEKSVGVRCVVGVRVIREDVGIMTCNPWIEILQAQSGFYEALAAEKVPFNMGESRAEWQLAVGNCSEALLVPILLSLKTFGPVKSYQYL